LHPFRNDFRDIFSLKWDIADSWLLQNQADNTSILRNAAEFLFSKMHYVEASGLFLALAQKPEPDQAVHEKLAYCFQMMGNFRLALEYYKRAELFDSNRLWSLKKIIFCYRKLGDIESALKWSLEAVALDTDDAYLQTMLGNCYLDLHQFEKALDHYFKADILAPENKKVLRPIAWCCFVLGKLDLALTYCQLILDEDHTANDLINAGHIELCLGNKPKAMERYIAAIASGGTNLLQFTETLDFDKRYLIANGVDPTDIQLITDYLRFR
jgi:tetratricopeptide (TPR) repeat protein